MSQQALLFINLKVLRADGTEGILLTTESFIKWYHDTGPQQLVILGEMGCRKFVAIVFLQQHLKKKTIDYPVPRLAIIIAGTTAQGRMFRSSPFWSCRF